MSDENALRQKVREMASLSVLAGRISEVQEKNLKMFPLVMFNGLKTVTIDYDLAHRSFEGQNPQQESSVTYHFDMDVDVENSHIEKRFKALEQAVRGLFWNDIIVRVYINKSLKFESEIDE